MATRQSKSKKYQVDHSTLTTSEGRDYEYRQVIEKRFKEAADCKRRLGILLMLQAVYHLGTVFIAYGSTLEGFAPAPAAKWIFLVGIGTPLLANYGMNARKTSRKLLYLKVYRYMCAFLAGVSLYIFVLYRTHIKLNNFPSAILGRSLHKSTGWHSGFCVSLVQGLETGLEIIGVIGQICCAVVCNQLEISLVPQKQA